MECYYVFCAEQYNCSVATMVRPITRCTSETVVYDWFTRRQHIRFTDVLLNVLHVATKNDVTLERIGAVAFFTVHNGAFSELHGQLPDIFAQAVRAFEDIEAAKRVEDI